MGSQVSNTHHHPCTDLLDCLINGSFFVLPRVAQQCPKHGTPHELDQHRHVLECACVSVGPKYQAIYQPRPRAFWPSILNLLPPVYSFYS